MVLITERNETLSEIYGRLLSRAGYNTVVMKSAEESSAYIDNGSDDVEFLVLCLKSPAEAERLLVEKFGKRFPGRRVFLLVDEMTEEVRAFIDEHNIDACLTKPFLPSDLLKRISLFFY